MISRLPERAKFRTYHLLDEEQPFELVKSIIMCIALILYCLGASQNLCVLNHSSTMNIMEKIYAKLKGITYSFYQTYLHYTGSYTPSTAVSWSTTVRSQTQSTLAESRAL